MRKLFLRIIDRFISKPMFKRILKKRVPERRLFYRMKEQIYLELNYLFIEYKKNNFLSGCFTEPQQFFPKYSHKSIIYFKSFSKLSKKYRKLITYLSNMIFSRIIDRFISKQMFKQILQKFIETRLLIYRMRKQIQL